MLFIISILFVITHSVSYSSYYQNNNITTGQIIHPSRNTPAPSTLNDNNINSNSLNIPMGRHTRNSSGSSTNHDNSSYTSPNIPIPNNFPENHLLNNNRESINTPLINTHQQDTNNNPIHCAALKITGLCFTITGIFVTAGYFGK